MSRVSPGRAAEAGERHSVLALVLAGHPRGVAAGHEGGLERESVLRRHMGRRRRRRPSALGELDAAESLARDLDSRAEHWSSRKAWRIADVCNPFGAVLSERGQLEAARTLLGGTWQAIAEAKGEEPP